MRRVYSALFVVIFIAVQLMPAIIGIFIGSGNPDLTTNELLMEVMTYQVIAFAIGALLMMWLHTRHTNKNRIELSPSSNAGMTIVWIVAGTVLAFVVQMVTALINVSLLGNPIESANTQSIIAMVMERPYIILAVALFGPIIEEFVFRRAIFGEIYEIIPGHKALAFIVAAVISGLIFAMAHLDFTHIIVYLGMSFTFSFLYVISGRILVPIFVHMLMNGTVVLVQIFGPSVEELEEQQQLLEEMLGVILRLFS